jgi:hypothetical protein
LWGSVFYSKISFFVLSAEFIRDTADGISKSGMKYGALSEREIKTAMSIATAKDDKTDLGCIICAFPLRDKQASPPM